ncbi:hypothetical protein ACEQPO_04515 [Bacillus sp. SL00103]
MKESTVRTREGGMAKVETRLAIKPMLNQHYPVAVKGGIFYMIVTEKIYRWLIGGCHGKYWTWHTKSLMP